MVETVCWETAVLERQQRVTTYEAAAISAVYIPPAGGETRGKGFVFRIPNAGKEGAANGDSIVGSGRARSVRVAGTVTVRVGLFSMIGKRNTC